MFGKYQFEEVRFQMEKIIGFADGENLVLRYQAMIAAGRKPAPGVIHVKDFLIWHPKVIRKYLGDYQRVSFYQTVVGDEVKLNAARKQISEVSYKYSVGENITGTGYLVPKIFKKEGRTSKSKSVDINITVDMMRHSSGQSFDALFLLSGDGDYLPLIEEVARRGIQVWVAAFSQGLSPTLRYSADQFIDLDQIFFAPIAAAPTDGV